MDMVKQITQRVVKKRDLLGLLTKNTFLVLMISTIKEAETIDSINQPVRN
ncbi:hypothetical protein [Leptospira kirschneri]|nr:hypothetical protein LEP1GSC042_0959 [Leptospira kirschneri serovar Bim str. PUO 1247]